MRPNRILQLIKTKGPLTAKQIAGELGITTEGARQQLVRLSEEGLVHVESSSKGVGRPVQLYELTSEGNAFFPNNHANLTIELLDSIKQIYGESGLGRVVRRRENTLLDKYRLILNELSSFEDRLRAYVTLRNEEGYMAELSKEEDGSFLFIENNCPICSAAENCEQFCTSDLKILKQILGKNTKVLQLKNIAEGQRRCVYRIEE